MRAVTYQKYGSPDVLELSEIEKPVVGDDDVLVKVRAASVNPYDDHFLRGEPYVGRVTFGLLKPKLKVLGADFAGQVEAVGKNVRDLQPGDEVYGLGSGAFAEYMTVSKAVVKKPANLTFEQAAAVPMAALTALQGLRDKGHIQAGQKVLVIGASGGIGTFAVQMAKAFGAEVTGVCSTTNLEMVRRIGADHVIDYTKEDFTRGGQAYDLILDTVGNRSIADRKRALSPTGILVVAGGQTHGWGFAIMGTTIWLMVSARWSGSKKAVPMLAAGNDADLVTLRELLETGKVTPVIDKSYSLSEAAQALAHVGEGHTQGKTVITI